MANHEVPDILQLRGVTVKGAVYIRAEDVADYFREFGGTEDADVCDRCEFAARKFEFIAGSRA